MNLSKIFDINLIKFIHLNFMSKKVVRHGKGYIVPHRNSVIQLDEGAKIELYDGNFHVNYNKARGSKAEAYVKMKPNSTLIIRENTVLNYLATIEVHKGGVIDIGRAIINSGAVILAAKQITIGKDVLISRNVYIYDSDHHKILNEQQEIVNETRPVIIGDHVWIGLKCTILRGAEIGEGVIVAADSVVGGKIKPGLLAQGNPARGYTKTWWEI